MLEIAHVSCVFPDSKVHGANMGPIWGRQDPGGPHVSPMNFAIWIVVKRKSIALGHKGMVMDDESYIFELRV